MCIHFMKQQQLELLLLLNAFPNLQCSCVRDYGVQRTSCHCVWSHLIFSCRFLLREAELRCVSAARIFKWEITCWGSLAPCCGCVAYTPPHGRPIVCFANVQELHAITAACRGNCRPVVSHGLVSDDPRSLLKRDECVDNEHYILKSSCLCD